MCVLVARLKISIAMIMINVILMVHNKLLDLKYYLCLDVVSIEHTGCITPPCGQRWYYMFPNSSGFKLIYSLVRTFLF